MSDDPSRKLALLGPMERDADAGFHAVPEG